MKHFFQKFSARLVLAACVLLTLKVHAGNPLWNGAGSVTNNFFSNTNNWVAGSVPLNNSINGLSVNFGPLSSGATNTANCDATGNSGVWTFNAGTPSLVVTLNSTNQLGAVTGPDVFVNNSTNLQTITGTFRLFDINVSTNSRRFNAAAGPLAITPSTLTLRGDSSPTNWAIELGGSATGSILNCGFANGGSLGGKTVNLLKTGTGSWEIMSALPNLTTNASSVTVAAGALTLDAANTYTGLTIVSNGAILNMTTLAAGAGAYAVSNAATLGVSVAAAGSSLTNASLTLGTASPDTTTLNINLGGWGNPTQPVITVNGALMVNGATAINITNSVLSAGQFSLIQYGSQTGATNLVLGSLPDYTTASLSNNLANTSIDLVVTVSNAPVSWNGNLSAVWDINTTANWQIGGVAGQFYQEGSSVVFDDTASGNYAVTLNSGLHPQSVTVSNNVNSYSFGGSGGISWTAGLSKTGSNMLTLNEANYFGGPVVVGTGALVLNNLNSVTGPGGMNIADGAVVQPKLAGTYANITTTINGASTANGSFGGSLDFHASITATWPGQINLNDPSATIGCFGGFPKVTLSGQLTGSGSLTLWPEGGSGTSHTATFILSNPNNNYAGSTTMQVGNAELSATLKLGVNNGLPVTTTLNLNRAGSSGTVYFDLAGYSQTVAGLTSDFGSNAMINSTGTGTLTVSNTTDTVFNGVIGVSGQAAINLIKQGSAALTLNGANIYTGSTTIGGGTLTLNGLITATSGWQMSNNATLQLALGAPGGPTNIVVKGNVTLAGQIGVNDYGIVSNTSYPIIYYTGKLTNNALTVAPGGPCAFTIDTNTPHMVYLDVTQKYPAVEFTSVSSAVSTLTTNLSGVLNGTPAGPIWYEVRDQTNKLWDFGATLAVSPWSITVRHLRAGTNTVTVFAQDNGGNIQSKSIQLKLTLGTYPAVRPRPIPSEIWWGGFVDNSQLTNYSQWPFVQKYEDGFFLRGVDWPVPDTAALQQSLATNLSAFNTKYAAVMPGYCSTPSTNWYQSETNTTGTIVGGLQSSGIVLSEITHDYHMDNMQLVCQVNPNWPTNDDIAWWTGDLTIATTNYPYTNPPSGIWRDVFNGYYQMFPHLKVGHISQPEGWSWGNFPPGTPNGGTGLTFSITNSLGQTNNISLNASNVFNSFMNMAGAIGHPYFSMQSDTPWNWFGGPGGGGGGTPASKTAMRQMIRAYEQNFQSRGCRHTLICNVSDASTNNQGTMAAADAYYENSSLSSMMLHQQEGGRANGYRFQSWYQGVPYVVVPETNAGSYTHLALSAIKYLKGIKDTNGTLEQLTFTLSGSGVTNLIQLTNNGDVACLPAVAAYETGAGGGVITYFNAAGSNITAAILSPEGYVHTNLLNAGQGTQIKVIATNGLNRTVTLEAFWNPQDPTGVVRDRITLAPPNQPPELAAVSNLTVIAGQTIALTNTATDPDLPAQTLIFSLVTPPVGASINSSNGLFTWRPTIAQSPSTNLFTIQVTDSGTPALSATNRFYVTVIPPPKPTISAPGLSNGQFSFTVNGTNGPDYFVLASTNLISWLPLWTNSSPTLPFSYTNAVTNFSQFFYRVLLGP